jgi:hypothetical protein
MTLFLTDPRGKEIKPQNPLSVDNVRVASEREQISSESVTFVTGAAGFTGSVALDKAPISNLLGNAVGSFWRKDENRLLGSDLGDGRGMNVTAVVETAASATVTISSPSFDIEELFETPSGTARAVIELTDRSGGTLYGYVGGVVESGTSYTIDVYDTPTLATQSWVGTLGSFTFATGTRFAIYRNNSSFAWVTGTVLAQEVDFPDGGDVVGFLDGLTAGQFGIDYGKGTIHYKKATTGTSDTCNYSILKSYQTASISGTVTVDSEFPAAQAVSDAVVNPTTTSVMALTMRWNGTSWERVTSFGGGGTGGGGDSLWSTDYGDFTAAATNATNSIVLSVDSVGGMAITQATFANGTLKVWDASDSQQKTIDLTKATWTAGTRTIDTSACTGAFTFATADVVSLTFPGPLKRNDTVSDSMKTVEQAPIYTRQTGETLATLTNIAANTTGYLYLDMQGYRKFAFECDTSGTTPTDTLTLTVEATWQDDGTAQASCLYQDVTNAWFGVASAVDSDTSFEKNDDTAARYVRLKYVTSNTGGSDADLTVYARRSW